MGSTTATYKFVAAAGTPAGPGTAAEGAGQVLKHWAGEAPGRSCEVLEDRAVYLLARLQHDDAEGAAARDRLFTLLAEAGLKSAILPCGVG